MKIAAPDLPKYLAPLRPIYLISGEDPFLKQEASDLIRQACLKAGFEREVFQVGAKEDWGFFYEACDDLSLFADRKLIELRLSAGKLAAEAEAAILHYLNRPSPDLVVLLMLEKLDSSASKSKGYTAIDASGIILPIWPVKPEEMLAWVSTRARARGLKLSPTVLAALAERTAGNLLAAHQELEKWALLPPGQSEADILATIADQDRYDIFALSDAILQKNAKRALRILESLRSEAAEPTLILWALSRDLQLFEQVLIAKAQNQSLEFIFKKALIWPQKQKIFMAYVSALTLSKIYENLILAQEIDQTIKGRGQLPVWDLLSRLVLKMLGLA